MAVFNLKRANPVSIVEIGNDWLKTAENTAGTISKASFIKLAAIKEEVYASLSRVFKETSLSRRGVIICIPRHLVTIRILEFPSIDPKEISDMVALQVSKQTPYSKEEIFSAHKILGVEREGYTKVMLAIARRNIISERIETLEKAGIQVGRVVISTEGVCNWFIGGYAPAKEFASCTVAITDVDSNYSDFIVIKNGKLVLTRSILIGANQLMEEGAGWREKFVEEIKHSIDLYRGEERESGEIKLFVSGAAKNMKGLSVFVAERTGIDVKEISDEKAFRVKGEMDIARNPDYRFVSVSALLGITSGTRKTELDLTPPELRIQKKMDRTRRQLVIMGILFTSIIMLASLLLLINIYDKNAYLYRLEQEIAKIESDANSIEKMRLRINMVERRRDMKDSSINILSQIYRLMPREIYLTNLSIKEEGEINTQEEGRVILRGRALAMSDVFKYVTTLEQADVFENVNTTYATAKREDNNEYIDFEITCIAKTRNDI